jgi:site-specific recombinase XerC
MDKEIYERKRREIEEEIKKTRAGIERHQTKDIKLTQESLGHSNIATTLRYVNLNKKDTTARLNNAFDKKNKTS